jgi:hypothetical protein
MKLSLYLIKHYTVKTYGEWTCSSMHYKTRHYMEVNGQLQALAAILLEKEPPVSTG